MNQEFDQKEGIININVQPAISIVTKVGANSRKNSEENLKQLPAPGKGNLIGKVVSHHRSSTMAQMSQALLNSRQQSDKNK